MEYREIKSAEITKFLFFAFERHQKVTNCWRKLNGEWIVKKEVFIDQWSDQDYLKLIGCLKNTIKRNGVLYGAFEDGKLKGFASVESILFGKGLQYLDLSSLHVSEDMRRMGIGKQLFRLSEDWGRAHGAQKLYISAHSAVESQAFYKAMDCTEAAEYSTAHTEQEPLDCQLECVI